MIELLILLLALAALLVLSMMGRRNHPGLARLQGWRYAHRGLHDPEKPENSMAAFQAAVDRGYGIELDIHLLQDGTLAVIHDSLLLRTTGREGKVEELTLPDLDRYFLEGTDQTIPALDRVLALVKGRVPLIVELKTDGSNYAPLSQAVCDLLEGYDGVYCLESFDPRCIQWLRKHRPDLVRGQLSENSLKSTSKIPWLLRFLLTNHMGNFLSRPDFIAYRFQDRKNLATWLTRKLWKVQGVSWTLRTREEFDQAVAEGWLPIFENFIP